MDYEVIASYKDWTIFKSNGKYYVNDGEDIKEVEPVKKVPSADYDKDVVDFYCDFSGMTDDFQYCMGFNYKNPWNKVEDGLPSKRGYYLLLFNTHEINAGFFRGKTFPLDNHWHKVIGWMELPVNYL